MGFDWLLLFSLIGMSKFGCRCGFNNYNRMKNLKKTMFLCAALCVLPFFLFCQDNLRKFRVNHDCTVSEVKDSVVVARVDTVSIEMIFVEGDTFKMGCTSEQTTCFNDEKPVHDVVLSDFYISKTEITQSLWKTVMDGWSPADAPDGTYNIGDDYPMCNVSWDDIVGSSGDSYIENGIRYFVDGFCYKLSVKLNGGNTTGMKHYRLPTEAEWEYAARGGIKSKGYKYSGSDTLDDVAWCKDNKNSGTGYGTKPVGTKKGNELGIHDMSGNVFERCADSWDGSDTYPSTLQVNPCVLLGVDRLIRSGSWDDDAKYHRVSGFRFHDKPNSRDASIGFRVAVTF
jgi:formylglycine-generating enzyme required for sulfatase activity